MKISDDCLLTTDYLFLRRKMMAQSTMTTGIPSNFKNGGATPANLSLISSLASLEQFLAELGTPVSEPAPELERGRAASKKPQIELLVPFEVGPYR
jgi:hypothetical protein